MALARPSDELFDHSQIHLGTGGDQCVVPCVRREAEVLAHAVDIQLPDHVAEDELASRLALRAFRAEQLGELVHHAFGIAVDEGEQSNLGANRTDGVEVLDHRLQHGHAVRRCHDHQRVGARVGLDLDVLAEQPPEGLRSVRALFEEGNDHGLFVIAALTDQRLRE
jgi:hypothetical protein